MKANESIHLGDGAYLTYTGYSFEVKANSHEDPTDIVELDAYAAKALVGAITETLGKAMKQSELDEEVLEQSKDLVSLVSYAEIVGGIGVNQSSIRKLCDSLQDLFGCRVDENEDDDATTITTNARFDKLTNHDIETHYRDFEYCIFMKDISSALAYWITAQNHNIEHIDCLPAIKAFEHAISHKWPNPAIPEAFTYDELSSMIHEDGFIMLDEFVALNDLKPDFISLGALARNVFYMVLREQITQ